MSLSHTFALRTRHLRAVVVIVLERSTPFGAARIGELLHLSRLLRYWRGTGVALLG